MARGLFPLGGPVGAEDLVGRNDLLNSLVARLSEGQSVMLAGPRRIGKTSLAHEALRRVKKQGFYTASVDFFRFSSKREFATSLIDAGLENRTGIAKTLSALGDKARLLTGGAHLAFKLHDLEFSLGFPDKRTENELLDYALCLPGILAQRDKKPMVVMMDEFQEAARATNDPEIFKKMRANFQHQKKVAYLFLGSKEGMMQTLFSGRQEAFYRFATMLPIPGIKEDEWIPYIISKFASRQIEASESTVRAIVRLAGSHPQDTMFLCSEVYYTLLETGNSVLNQEYIDLGYNRALLALAPVFDGMIEDANNQPHARQVLNRLALDENPYGESLHPNQVKRAVDYLISKAVIQKTARGSYSFIEPMFKDYLLKACY